MREQLIQKKISSFLEKIGYVVIKITVSNWNGIPDLLVLVGDSQHFWIEVKKPDGVLSSLQEYRIKCLKQLGDTTIVAYGYNDFLTQYKSLELGKK